jgi:hypothetical protein
MWLFDPVVPLAPMPLTGVGGMRRVLWGAVSVTALVALAALALILREKRRAKARYTMTI